MKCCAPASAVHRTVYQNKVPFYQPYVTVGAKQVQDKVLSLSLDQTVSQELSRTSCSHCGASMYEAALVCQSCHQTFEACCVSGKADLTCTVVCHALMHRVICL